ncbi:MAG TPA: lipoprotein [Casimicrobiaceae bacterium]|nr:lipoprotein [Casimicrobiaceae bacterium]
MVRLPFLPIAAALALTFALCGCGVKGPLVPAKKATETAAPPPPATTTPAIPSATLPSNPQPAP